MSCYKCGKELPAGEVECANGCGEANQLALCLEMELDAQTVGADPQGFNAARAKFATMLGEILVFSGMDHYVKAPK